MYNLKNLTNSPYLILLADGSQEMLPARGELTKVDINPVFLQRIKNCGFIELTEVEAKTNPKQSAKAEEKKPENKSEDDELTDLAWEYEELTGKEPDARWSKRRLMVEVEKAKK